MAENEKKNSKYEGMSASKAKRERQKEEREKDKRAKVRGRVIAGLVVLAIVGCIGAAYGRQWYKEKNKIKPSTDYSAMLNEDGTIQNVNVTDYVKDFDVNSVKIAAAELPHQAFRILTHRCFCIVNQSHSRAVSFETASLSAPARPSGSINYKMSHFRARSVKPGIDFPIYNHSTADSGSNRQHQKT